MEIEESPYFIKLAPGLSILRQRSDLALPHKEQKTLGRKAGVQRTCSSAMFSSRKKSKTFPLQMKWDSRRPRASRCPMRGTILFQSLFAAPWKPLTAVKSSLVSGQSKGRGMKPLIAHGSGKPRSFYGPEPYPELLWRLQCVVKTIFFHHTSIALKFTELNLLNFKHFLLFLVVITSKCHIFPTL